MISSRAIYVVSRQFAASRFGSLCVFGIPFSGLWFVWLGYNGTGGLPLFHWPSCSPVVSLLVPRAWLVVFSVRLVPAFQLSPEALHRVLPFRFWLPWSCHVFLLLLWGHVVGI